MSNEASISNPLRQTVVKLGICMSFIIICMGFRARAGETIPPAPAHYFNDYAHVVTDPVANRLDAQLAQFEKDTTGQIVVAIFPEMPANVSIEDYSLHIFNAWKIGQKGKNNGLLLVVFVKDHKMRIETGRGFEKTVTDAICRKILNEEITPHFRKGDYDGGLIAAVNAMIAATRGEYATEQTPSPAPSVSPSPAGAK